MLSSFRHSRPPMKHLNHAALALTNTSIEHVMNGLAGRHNYADDKGQGCCKDVAQTTGMKVEPWPKPDNSPQPWRVECPQEPQPPNYDPYRIKVPETVVPPLPPCNVKRIGVLNTTTDDQHQDQQAGMQRQQSSSGYHHHQGYHQGYQQSCEDAEPKDSSFLGRLKGFFGRLRGKRKQDGDSMMTASQNINWLYRY